MKILRLILLPFGLLWRLLEMSNNGSRDLQNKIRFKGAQIERGCCINGNTRIASGAYILSNCILNNCDIAAYSYLGKDCKIQNTKMGLFCSVADSVSIGLGKHPHNLFSTSPLFYRRKNIFNFQLVDKDISFEEYENISIGHDVWIGARAIILDGITISTGAIVAANSVVTKDVPPYAIVAGVPGKVISYRFEKEKIDALLRLGWWNWPVSEIKERLNELYSI